MDETPIERQLRLKKIEVDKWNQTFWTKHNQRFINVSVAINSGISSRKNELNH